VTGDCHAGILWEPGGEIPPGHPTQRDRESIALITANLRTSATRIRRLTPANNRSEIVRAKDNVAAYGGA